MMVIFNDDGHFLYYESIKATEEKRIYLTSFVNTDNT